MNNIIKGIKKNENILFYGIIVVTLLLAFVVGEPSSPDEKGKLPDSLYGTWLTNKDDIEAGKKAEEVYQQAIVDNLDYKEERMKFIEEYLDSRSKSELDQLRADFDNAKGLTVGEMAIYKVLHERDNSGPSLSIPTIVLGGVALGVVSLVKFDVITPKKEDDLEEHKL